MPEPETIDMRTLPRISEIDRTVMPSVEEELTGIHQVIVGTIGRFRSGFEYYAPVDHDGPGGMLSLSQAQTRHLTKELVALVQKWDTEPRDLAAEADMILRDAGHRGRNRASSGYEIETDGTAVYVYYADGRGRGRHTFYLSRYAEVLKQAGYTSPDNGSAPVIEGGTDEHAPRVYAIPPAAESF